MLSQRFFYFCAMANNDDQFKKVISHAKEYGYIFGSSEIYDGLSAVYDYGQQGVELKKNIREYWWRSMVHMHQNIVGLDTACLLYTSPSPRDRQESRMPSSA